MPSLKPNEIEEIERETELREDIVSQTLYKSSDHPLGNSGTRLESNYTVPPRKRNPSSKDPNYGLLQNFAEASNIENRSER